MRRKRLLVSLAAVICVMVVVFAVRRLSKDPVPYGEPTALPEGEGWVDLLDEAHAGHWANVTDDKEIFEIKDGVLHIFGRTLLPLRYAGYKASTFTDFDLHLEFKVTKRANSGVFLRSHPNDPVYRGFEVQVLDDFGKRPSKNGCGAIYDVATPMYNMSRPAGEWNSYDITVDGPEVIVMHNGWMVIHTDLSKMTMHIGKYKALFAELPTEGNLLLQDHGGEVWYRNIRIRERK